MKMIINGIDAYGRPSQEVLDTNKPTIFDKGPAADWIAERMKPFLEACAKRENDALLIHREQQRLMHRRASLWPDLEE